MLSSSIRTTRLFTTSLLLAVAAVSAFSNPAFRPSVTPALHAATTAAAAAPSPIKTFLDDANYDRIIKNNNRQGGKAVLVDACYQWCGPCKLIDPFLRQAAVTFGDELDVVKFDVEAKNTGGVKLELLLQGVMPKALPFLILFQDGEAVATHEGALKQDELNAFIASNLQKQKVTQKAKQQQKQKGGFISFGNGGGLDDYALVPQ